MRTRDDSENCSCVSRIKLTAGAACIVGVAGASACAGGGVAAATVGAPPMTGTLSTGPIVSTNSLVTHASAPSIQQICHQLPSGLVPTIVNSAPRSTIAITSVSVLGPERA